MKSKVITVLIAACIMAITIVGCGKSMSEKNNKSTTENTSEANLRGKIQLAGSTSMEKLCNAMSESFMEKNPEVTVTVEYTGSGAGLEALAAGSVNIGDASRKIKEEEKKKGILENIVALDGIAMITNKNNSIKDVTSKNLAKIYKGEIKNWKALGGKDEQIVVIGREAGSGTRDAFEELVGIKDSCKYAQELDSTGAVLAKVASTPGAIGYVSLDVINNTVSSLKLNGVKATEKQILAGKYLLQRPFVMATKGKISEQSNLVKAWFKYIKSNEGKAVIRKAGLIIPKQ